MSTPRFLSTWARRPRPRGPREGIAGALAQGNPPMLLAFFVYEAGSHSKTNLLPRARRPLSGSIIKEEAARVVLLGTCYNRLEIPTLSLSVGVGFLCRR